MTERTEALAVANERLRELALKDPLTGLANRMAMLQQLEQAWQRARRRHEMLAVILLDLDGFKPVNDSHGHEAGDQLLVQVARRLQDSARTTDRLGKKWYCTCVLSPESVVGPAVTVVPVRSTMPPGAVNPAPSTVIPSMVSKASVQSGPVRVASAMPNGVLV